MHTNRSVNPRGLLKLTRLAHGDNFMACRQMGGVASASLRNVPCRGAPRVDSNSQW